MKLEEFYFQKMQKNISTSDSIPLLRTEHRNIETVSRYYATNAF